MGVDVYFHRVKTLKELKEDTNLVINQEPSYIGYGDSHLTLYSPEDDDYLTIARYCGSDFTELLKYLWEHHGIMVFDDVHFDEQIFYRVMSHKNLTEDEKTAWADYYCAGYMLTNVLPDDEKLKKCLDDNEELREIVEEKMFHEANFTYKFNVLLEKYTGLSFRMLMRLMTEDLKIDNEAFLTELQDMVKIELEWERTLKKDEEQRLLNPDELPF